MDMTLLELIPMGFVPHGRSIHRSERIMGLNDRSNRVIGGLHGSRCALDGIRSSSSVLEPLMNMSGMS
jgi:hypothetical protein